MGLWKTSNIQNIGANRYDEHWNIGWNNSPRWEKLYILIIVIISHKNKYI